MSPSFTQYALVNVRKFHITVCKKELWLLKKLVIDKHYTIIIKNAKVNITSWFICNILIWSIHCTLNQVSLSCPMSLNKNNPVLSVPLQLRKRTINQMNTPRSLMVNKIDIIPFKVDKLSLFSFFPKTWRSWKLLAQWPLNIYRHPEATSWWTTNQSRRSHLSS